MAREPLSWNEEWWAARQRFTANEKVYFRGETKTFSNGSKVKYGWEGTVTGPHPDEPDKRVWVTFPRNKARVGCLFTELCRSWPPVGNSEYSATAALLAQLLPRADGKPAPVRLLKGSWLLARADKVRRARSDAERERLALPRRQELPPEAFLTAKEVGALRGHDGGRADRCTCYWLGCGGRPAEARPLRLLAASYGAAPRVEHAIRAAAY